MYFTSKSHCVSSFTTSTNITLVNFCLRSLCTKFQYPNGLFASQIWIHWIFVRVASWRIIVNKIWVKTKDFASENECTSTVNWSVTIWRLTGPTIGEGSQIRSDSHEWNMKRIRLSGGISNIKSFISIVAAWVVYFAFSNINYRVINTETEINTWRYAVTVRDD